MLPYKGIYKRIWMRKIPNIFLYIKSDQISELLCLYYIKVYGGQVNGR